MTDKIRKQIAELRAFNHKASAGTMEKMLAVVEAARELRAADRPHDLCMNNAQFEHSGLLCADCKLMEALAALEKDE